MKKVLVKLKHDMSGHICAPPRQDKINCTCANISNTHMNSDSHTKPVTTFEVSINSHMCWQ
jgi:hypothetical protein